MPPRLRLFTRQTLPVALWLALATAAQHLAPKSLRPRRRRHEGVQAGQLRERNAVLTAKLRALEPQANADLFTDVAVFGKAVDYVLRFPERLFRKEACPEATAPGR